jgi:hypothetical protein
LNNDGVSFAVGDAAQAETSGSSIVFTVTKSGTTSSSFSLNYATADGTASSASDYWSKSGTVTFGPSEIVKYIEVGLKDDATAEGTESFKLNLSGAPNGSTITDAQGVGTINDND